MKDNKVIAEFMGMKYSDERSFNDGEWTHSIKSLSKFKTSWDWLMPVVEKIESNQRYDVDILQYGTRIVERTKTDSIDIVNNIADISFDSKIDHTYDAVVKFINHINKEKL
jgi:hypothetical protein